MQHECKAEAAERLIYCVDGRELAADAILVEEDGLGPVRWWGLGAAAE